MYDLLKKLFPLNRSITGDGLSNTLDILSEKIPLNRYSYKTGANIFDWKVPEEWNIESAFIKNEADDVIVDFKKNNLHLMGYSTPVKGWFTLDELKEKLYSLPDMPYSIPYRTSYYKRDWGFCLPHNLLSKLNDNKYYVEINSSFKNGELVFAEAKLPGKIDKDILLSCYICHPSMANDSLSGVVLLSKLYELLSQQNRYYGYRFIFIPETIGSIAYLYKYRETIKEWFHAGIVCTCVGDSGTFNYKKSRKGSSSIDKIVENIFKYSNYKYSIREFWPEGSDERQFCSPGFDLPMGSLMRSVYGEFPEYHTSKDNLNFVRAEYLEESLEVYLKVLKSLQLNGFYTNTVKFCEPFFSKYDLYPSSASHIDRSDQLKNILWLMNYSDGVHELVDIANMANKSILEFEIVVKELTEKGLLKREI